MGDLVVIDAGQQRAAAAAERERLPARFFCFDLAGPHCWLAAERALSVLGGPLEWLPVSAAQISASARLDAAFRCQIEVASFQEDVAIRAQRLGLPQPRWPQPFPFDDGVALLAATYARGIGKVVPYALAALRQAFAGGHALDRDHAIIAGAACEMHPAAILRAIETRAVAEQLHAASAHAAAHRVRQLPAVVLDGELFQGERELERAGVALVGLREAGR